MIQNQPPDWWKHAVFYQIYPRSFYDSNNDGIGDLNGVIEKLDYFNDGQGGGLGIDAIWFSPIFKSPQRDFGYDTSDYCDIDPGYGTLADYDRLVEECHRRGFRIVLDLVLNHSSDLHPWFQESKQDRTNPKQDWYVWVDPKDDGSVPNNWLSLFGGKAWTFNEARGQYYMHSFLKEQPDLNWYNPEVREELAKVVRFWMTRGTDGFRMDTVNFFAYDQQLRDNPQRDPSEPILEKGQAKNPYFHQNTIYSKDRPENLEFIHFLRELFDEIPGTTSIGEMGSNFGLEGTIRNTAEYVKGQKHLHMAYTFAMLSTEMNADYFSKIVELTEHHFQDGWPCWSLGNHDTKRLMSRFECKGEREGFQQMMLMLLLCLRGTPILYYGEELDMEEIILEREQIQDPLGIYFWPEHKGRDGCRTPFPWNSGEPNQGFNQGAEPWLSGTSPICLDQAEEMQESTLHLLREMLKIRKSEPALQSGSYRLHLLQEDCLIFQRETDQQSITVAANFSVVEQRLDHDFSNCSDLTPKIMNRRGRVDGTDLVLPPSGFFIAKH